MKYYLFGAGWNGQWIERPEQDGEFLVGSELIPATEYTEDDDEKERVSSSLNFRIKKVILSSGEEVCIAYYGDEPATEHIESSIE